MLKQTEFFALANINALILGWLGFLFLFLFILLSFWFWWLLDRLSWLVCLEGREA